jgi:hypothetical protein
MAELAEPTLSSDFRSRVQPRVVFPTPPRQALHKTIDDGPLLRHGTIDCLALMNTLAALRAQFGPRRVPAIEQRPPRAVFTPPALPTRDRTARARPQEVSPHG